MRSAGARPAPSPLEERAQRHVHFVRPLVVREVTPILHERPLEIVLDDAECMRALDGVLARELSPEQQRRLAYATQRRAHVHVELSTQQRPHRVLATRPARHAHVVVDERGGDHPVVGIRGLETATHPRR